MLTVKHIEAGTKAEKIYAAASVEYRPRHLSKDALGPGQDGWSAACVFIENAKGEQSALGNWGKFYVMNEAGKTVATYDLGGDTTEQASHWTMTASEASEMLRGKTFTATSEGVRVYE